MVTQAMYPAARPGAGLYESFFLRAVCPEEPVGVWIRHTVLKPPGGEPRGSVWCTVFDARWPGPYMHKLGELPLSTPAGSWIAVGASAIGDGHAQGECGEARWSLTFAPESPPLRHLAPAWLYRAPLPRTKLTSPAPYASFHGTVELAGRGTLELDGWPGMVGHNWGSQHAERWLWVHALAFVEEPRAWLDVALARLKLGGRTTPWRATGALAFGGERRRLGGVLAREDPVREESSGGCTLELSGAGGLRVRAQVRLPANTAAGWRYADPDGSSHDVINSSIAAVELALTPRRGAPSARLHSPHGGAFELGVRERHHGVPIAPFPPG